MYSSFEKADYFPRSLAFNFVSCAQKLMTIWLITVEDNTLLKVDGHSIQLDTKAGVNWVNCIKTRKHVPTDIFLQLDPTIYSNIGFCFRLMNKKCSLGGLKVEAAERPFTAPLQLFAFQEGVCERRIAEMSCQGTQLASKSLWNGFSIASPVTSRELLELSACQSHLHLSFFCVAPRTSINCIGIHMNLKYPRGKIKNWLALS